MYQHDRYCTQVLRKFVSLQLRIGLLSGHLLEVGQELIVA